MATISLYLDKRATDNEAPLKIVIRSRQTSAMMPVGISLLPSQWDARKYKVINHPQKVQLNSLLHQKLSAIETMVAEMFTMDCKVDAKVIRQRIMSKIEEEELPSKGTPILPYFLNFAKTRRAESTCGIYMETYKKLQKYCKQQRIAQNKFVFEDIDKRWLESFSIFLEKNGSKTVNGRGIHLRNLRAVFNASIDEELHNNYPFRKFKIKVSATKSRALTVEQLRILFNYPVRPSQQEYLDMFKLTFFLIGINAIDLFTLDNNCIVGNRIEYVRKKTQKLYSIRIEPEAEELIEKYRGKKGNLLDISLGKTTIHQYSNRVNNNLQKIGPCDKQPGKRSWNIQPLFDNITLYWARHSWATIAAELDIPKETISHALGHSIKNVTDTYIAFNRKKIDEANRKVIDYVLYGKQ